MLKTRFAAQLAVMLPVGVGTSVAAAQDTIERKINTRVPETSVLYQFFALFSVERTRNLSDGRVELTPYPADFTTPSTGQTRSEAAAQLATDCCSPV